MEAGPVLSAAAAAAAAAAGNSSLIIAGRVGRLMLTAAVLVRLVIWQICRPLVCSRGLLPSYRWLHLPPWLPIGAVHHV